MLMAVLFQSFAIISMCVCDGSIVFYAFFYIICKPIYILSMIKIMSYICINYDILVIY